MKHYWKAVIYFAWPIYPVLRLHPQRPNWSQGATAAAWETSRMGVWCAASICLSAAYPPWLLLEILVMRNILTLRIHLIQLFTCLYGNKTILYHTVIRWLKHFTTWSQLNILGQQLTDVTETVFVHFEVRICFPTDLRTIFRLLVSRITRVCRETKCSTGAPSWQKTSVTVCVCVLPRVFVPKSWKISEILSLHVPCGLFLSWIILTYYLACSHGLSKDYE